MKKTTLLNSEISYVISKMGHTDSIVICDAGLPIPEGVQRIDLALKEGIPTFLDVLHVVLLELQVEEIILATELKTGDKNGQTFYTKIMNSFNDDVKVSEVKHEEFKMLTKTCKAIIRTGETTPYANIILKSGVVF